MRSLRGPLGTTVRFASALTAVIFLAAPLAASLAAQSPASPLPLRDGQHDFDFNIGVWRARVRYCAQQYTPAAHWIDLNGTDTVRQVWGGRAQLQEIELNGAFAHIEGLSIILYNPVAHQWSETFAGSGSGQLGVPSIGEFKDGRIVLTDQETLNGRAVLFKVVWSDIKPNSHHFEESFSQDNGQTWQPNFIADLTRISS